MYVIKTVQMFITIYKNFRCSWRCPWYCHKTLVLELVEDRFSRMVLYVVPYKHAMRFDYVNIQIINKNCWKFIKILDRLTAFFAQFWCSTFRTYYKECPPPLHLSLQSWISMWISCPVLMLLFPEFIARINLIFLVN